MNLRPFISFGIILLLSINVYAQWDENGNIINPGEFVGTLNTEPLELKTTQSEHINLFTEDNHRIKLNPDINYTINGYAGDRDGYMLLGNSTVGMNDDLFAEDTLRAYSLLNLI